MLSVTPLEPAVIAVQAAAAAAKGLVGEKKYTEVRSKTTWTLSAINGFSPIPPTIILFPIKIAIFIIVILVLIYAFHISAGWSALSAYLFQAVIVMLLSNWLMDKILKIGFGV